MRKLNRFFCDLPLQEQSHIKLPEAIAHYAGRVLRLKNHSTIILFNGTGGQYTASILFEGKHAFATITAFENTEAELPGNINLIQGLASGSKMDLIVEKAVELGVTGCWPIAAQYSVLQLQGDRLNKRLSHWQNISYAASEQCGRNRIMPVNQLHTIKSIMPILASKPNHITLLCHPEATKPLNTVLNEACNQWACNPAPKPTLNILVGPEGGWSDEEISLAIQHGAHLVQFGPRVLRSETAGIALVSACVALLNWNVAPHVLLQK